MSFMRTIWMKRIQQFFTQKTSTLHTYEKYLTSFCDFNNILIQENIRLTLNKTILSFKYKKKQLCF